MSPEPLGLPIFMLVVLGAYGIACFVRWLRGSNMTESIDNQQKDT